MPKKIPAFVLVLAIALAATASFAPSAGAWDQVCVHMPFWESGYSGDFVVVHGFPTAHGRIPNSYYNRETRSYWKLPDGLGAWHGVRADGAIESGRLTAGFSQCVSIRHLRNGEPFFVFVQPDLGHSAALCAAGSSSPGKWQVQKRGPFRKIWWRATGGAAHPNCDYWKEGD